MMEAIFGIIFGFVFITIILFIHWLVDYFYLYNKGICRKCGGKYRIFDIDSSGASGIICDNCGNHHWVHI